VRHSIVALLALLGVILVLPGRVSAQPAFGLPTAAGVGHHTQVTLRLSAATAKPGDTVLAGVDMKMEPGWHTYWSNPGEAGSATKIEWTLPPGVTAGDIQWPLPRKLPPIEVTTFGYEEEVVLTVPLTLAATLPQGPLTVSAKVSWLECKEQCLPANQTVTANLAIGAATVPSPDSALIDLWQSRVPRPAEGSLAQAWWEGPPDGDTRPLIIRLAASSKVNAARYDAADFFPAASDNYEIQPATDVLTAMTSEVRLRKLVKKFSGDWPTNVVGVVVTQTGSDRNGYQFAAAVAASAPSLLATGTAESPVPALPVQPLWRMLLYAFIGGLILNIMPCVLPVIALKILGFVSEAQNDRGRIRVLGAVYAMGVLVSFLALAAAVIGVKAAGHLPGWGMQFSSPIFVVGLTTLVLLVALNLFGVFEVTLSGKALDTAGKLTARHGASGAFFNGVLATILATPCTAPYLATALGFAFTQSAPIIVLIFLTVGLGLSAPYLILSWEPTWLKLLPRPGAWMEKFKNAMGFPMLATVVWLFSISFSSYGKAVFWLGIFLVAVALAAWIFGEFVQRGQRHRLAAGLIAALVLATGYGLALEKELNWRVVRSDQASATRATNSADGIAWQPWSGQAVAAAQASGKPVLVDFTADWCLTCQLNRRTSLEVTSVRDKLKALGAVTLEGDYTHYSDDITKELNRFHSAGVPLVLIYPKTPGTQPIMLPALLTPSIVLDALDQAAKK
jgi:thiol:disulfide interchange protein DsbD